MIIFEIPGICGVHTGGSGMHGGLHESVLSAAEKKISLPSGPRSG